METNRRFLASSAPHIFAKDTTAVLMLDVIAALMPTVAAGIWLFGWSAARVILISVVSCVHACCACAPATPDTARTAQATMPPNFMSPSRIPRAG